MTSTRNRPPVKIWQRVAILSLIVGIPALTIVASGITIYLAVKTDTPVIESYFKSGFNVEDRSQTDPKTHPSQSTSQKPNNQAMP